MSVELSLEEFGKNFRNPQPERNEKSCPFIRVIELNEALIGIKAEDLAEKNKGDRNVFCHLREDVIKWSNGTPQVPIETNYVPERACRLTFVRLWQQLQSIKRNDDKSKEILARWKNVISGEEFNDIYTFKRKPDSILSDKKAIGLMFSYIQDKNMFNIATFGCDQAPEGHHEEIPTDCFGQLD